MPPTPPPAPPPPLTPPPPPPPPPPVRPAPAYIDDSHSHLGYIALAVVLLLVGLAAGAAGGYFYAVMQQPVPAPAVTDQTPQAPAADTGVDANAGAAATTTNPLDTVKTNPFQ